MRNLSATLCLFAACAAFTFAATNASAEPPPLVPIQGYLADDAGAPLDGAVSATFTLYNAATGGEALHAETLSVPVDHGSFVAYLGSSQALDLSLFRDTTELYLGIQIEDDAEMSPRIRLATAPFAAYSRYAAEAGTLEGMAADDFVTAGSITWDDVSGIPTDLTDGDDDTHLTEAEVDAYVANNGYAVAADLAAVATTGSWTDLVGIPADLADGDDDTHLTEAEVDAYVANNGYAAAADLAAVATTGSWTDLVGIPADLADGDANTQLGEAEVDAYVANNGYAAAASLALVATSGSFDDLSDVPAGLADGDDDTTYAAGPGLVLDTTTNLFSVDQAALDADFVAHDEVDSVTGAMITDGTVTDADIADVDWSKVGNVPADLADGDQGTTDIFTINGAPATVSSVTAWEFLRAKSLTFDSDSRVIVQSTGSFSGNGSVFVGLCYQSSNDNSLNRFSNYHHLDFADHTGYSIVESKFFYAGTYVIGPCVLLTSGFLTSTGSDWTSTVIQVIR